MKEKVSKFKSLLVATSVLSMITYSSVMGAARDDIPLANYDIGNQATLTYQTLGGADKLLKSNTVLTRINQTYALTLDPDRTVNIFKGKVALFNHTLTNYGNGTDNFEITHNYDATRGVKIYLDANNNGVLEPDEQEIVPINEKYIINELGPWESQSIIVRVPTNSGDTAPTLTGKLTAKSLGSEADSINDSADETITFTADANVGVYKALSSASGASDITREITVYIKVFNDSTTVGTEAVLTDDLNTKFTYIENSAKWQGFNSDSIISLSDNNYNQDGIKYSVLKKAQGGPDNDKVTLTLATVPNNSPVESKGGVLSFKVLIKEGESVGSIPNTVRYTFKSGDTSIAERTSNTVTYSILKYVRATFTGDTIENAQAGQRLRFVNTFKNIGNASEIYNLEIADKFFPAGTTFLLTLQTPGQEERPILDTNGDKIDDTGIVGINEVINVILYAQLPKNITNLQSNYTVKKIATSTHTPSYNINTLDKLTTLTAATVDLTNNDDLVSNTDAPGKGLGPEQSPVTQISLNPGQKKNFILYVNNTSSYITDTFKLEVSTKADFSDQILPLGVGVKFKIGGEVEVKTTSPILPGDSQRVDAEVSVALNTVAKTVPLYFRVTSLTTGAKDIKYDSITINAIRDVSITPNNSGSTYAGGQIIYTHTVRNNGNVLEGDGAASEVNIITTETLTQWATEIFIDSNGNGIFDIGIDTAFRDFATVGGLSPGEEVKIFARVAAPVGAPAAAINITTIRPSVTQGTYSTPPTITIATDTTTILAEDLTIIKSQKLGEAESYTPDSKKANPGATIFYKIEVKNTGTVEAKNVKILDTIPYFTTILSGTGGGEGVGFKASYRITDAQGINGAFKVAETQPESGNRGEIVANVGILKPNEKATLYFQVKIDDMPDYPGKPPVTP